MADRRPDPELVAEVVLRLLMVRRRLGLATFQDAADRALVGIGCLPFVAADRSGRLLKGRYLVSRSGLGFARGRLRNPQGSALTNR